MLSARRTLFGAEPDKNGSGVRERRNISGVGQKGLSGPCGAGYGHRDRRGVWARRNTIAALGSGSVFAVERACPGYEREIRNGILVVEDEVLVRMVIADELRDAGYTVIEASNALEALELLRHNSVDVRLILSDVRMPGTMDGAALARTVRSEFPVTKIVLTSGNLTDLDWVEHDGFFPKPYNSEQIIKHINRLLD
jgi:CheY-like chemotaxis protein